MPALTGLFSGSLRPALRPLVAVVLISVGTPSYAECAHQDAACENAEEVVQLLGYGESLSQLRGSCVRGLAMLHPDRAYVNDRDAFFGLNPASSAWPEVVAAFEVFRQEVCGDEPFRRALLDRYRVAWQESMSERGMAATLTFLKSGEGREFARALVNAHRVVSEEYQRLDAERRPRALEKFLRRVQRIARGALTK